MSTASGPDARRVVQIFATRIGDAPSVGSGYLVTATVVLTAAHVLTAAVEVTIAGRADSWTTAGISWEAIGGDVAVIHLTAPSALVQASRAAYGTLGLAPHILDAVAVGYPAYRLTRTTAAGAPTKAFRDLDQAPGEIASLTGLISGTIHFHVNATYQPSGHAVPGESPWAGMSGAALWAGGHLVGVVTEDPTPDVPTALTATRLDHVLRDLGSAERTMEVRGLLGLGPKEPLPDASIDARYYDVILSHRLEALDRLPSDGLKDRSAELEAMIQFSRGDAQYFVWHADQWSGKTAVMSAFAAEPPGGLDVVSFFVNSQVPDCRDGEHFLVSVTRQLESLLGTPAAAERTPGAAHGDFLRLLAAVAAKCVSDSRQLILLVDGLDDDAALSSGRDRRTLVSLLPRHRVNGLQVIAATRPYETVLTAVDDDHPFVSTPAHQLSRSPYAASIEKEAQAEVRRAAAEEGLAEKTVGYLAAAGSGLTIAELAELTHSTPIAISTLLQTRLRRSVRPESAVNLGGTGDGALFRLSHQTLPGFVAERLGRRIEDVYRGHIHDWAVEWRRQGWTSRTPHYFITGYPALLDATEDLPRLLDYALDTERHDWLAASRGGDDQAQYEIRAAERLNLDREPVDLIVALRLARQRARIEDRNTNLPVGLLPTFAALGEAGRALSLAATITDDLKRVESLSAIAHVQVGAGHPDDAAATLEEALTSAHAVTDLNKQATALTLVANGHIALGQPSKALSLAAAITDDPKRVGSLTAIANAQMAAGHLGDAAATLEEAFTSAHAVTHLTQQAAALTLVANGQIALGETGRARSVAATITDGLACVGSLTAVANAQLAARHPDEAAATLDEALAAARGIPDREQEGMALTLIAQAQIALGQLDSAIPTLDLALGMVLAAPDSMSRVYPPVRVRALLAIAETETAAGLHDRAVGTFERAVEASGTFHEDYDYWRQWDTVAEISRAQAAAARYDEALATARLTSHPLGQGQGLAAIVAAQAAAGRYDQALDTARLIGDLSWKERALSAIVEAQAAAGRYDDALDTARLIGDPFSEARALSAIAAAQATAGLHDDALRNAESALATSRSIPDLQHEDAAAAAIAEAQSAAGLLHKAVNTARTISNARERAEGFSVVAAAQVARGALDDAAYSFELAIAAASSTPPGGQAEALAAVGKAQATGGLLDKAADTLDKARAAANSIDLSDRQARALASIANAQAIAGLPDQAAETAAAIFHARQKAEAFTAIARAQVTAGLCAGAEANLDNALRAADDLHFETWWESAVCAIAELYVAIGRYDKALAVPKGTPGDSVVPAKYLAVAEAKAGRHNQALASADTIPNAWQRADALRAVADVEVAGDRLDDARESLAQAALIVTDAGASWDAASTLAKLAQAQAAAGLRQQALATCTEAIAALASTPLDQVEVLTAVARAQAAAGRLQAAQSTLDQARNMPLGNLAAVAEAEVSFGLYEQAEATVLGIPNPVWRARALRHIALSALPSLEQPFAIPRRLIALALAAGPWYESVAAASQIEPTLLGTMNDQL